MAIVTLEELVDAGSHFGHQLHHWNPKMSPYIYAEESGIHIIDLIKTKRLLKHAYNYIKNAAKDGKTFIFIGTKRQATNIISEEAQKCKSFFVNNRWLGGILTNWSTLQNRVDRLRYLNRSLSERAFDGSADCLQKKEASKLRKERDKLEYNLGGVILMKKLPDVAIFVDPKREATALAECRKLGITIISILDTNCDPTLVDLPIPANDDSVKSIKLIISTLSKGILMGKQKVS